MLPWPKMATLQMLPPLGMPAVHRTARRARGFGARGRCRRTPFVWISPRNPANDFAARPRVNSAHNSPWYVPPLAPTARDVTNAAKPLTVQAAEPRARQWPEDPWPLPRPGARARVWRARAAKRCRRTPQHVRPKRQKLPRRYSRSHARETARPRSNARPRAG